MFNHKHIHHSTTSINVVEKRAATDDAIRLCGEIEAKMMERVVKSFIINDNVISATMLEMKHGPLAKTYVAFKLNGKSYYFQLDTEFDLLMHGDGHKAHMAIAEKIANVITSELFMQMCGAEKKT
jgi:hypothetical protein